MKLRERYSLHGPEGVGDADLVALVLETGCSGRSASIIAEDLLGVVGGMEGLAQSPVQALERVRGMGPARAVRLHAACAMGRRILVRQDSPPQVLSVQDAVRLFQPRLGGLAEEELHAIFLNRRNGLLAYRCLTRGNDGHTIVDPRQVFRHALLVGSQAVIVAHNHPSGDPTPSAADVEVSTRLASAGRLLGVDLLDHLIISGPLHRSLRESGLLPLTGASSTCSLSDTLAYGS